MAHHIKNLTLNSLAPRIVATPRVPGSKEAKIVTVVCCKANIDRQNHLNIFAHGQNHANCFRWAFSEKYDTFKEDKVIEFRYHKQ